MKEEQKGAAEMSEAVEQYAKERDKEVAGENALRCFQNGVFLFYDIPLIYYLSLISHANSHASTWWNLKSMWETQHFLHFSMEILPILAYNQDNKNNQEST